MSINLDIAPTAGEPVTWSALKEELLSPANGEGAGPPAEQVALVTLGDERAVGDHERLAIGASYRLLAGEPNTLLLSVMANRDNLDEREYLEDYGRNLSPEQLDAIVNRWRAAGHYYEVTTMGGRDPQEPALFVRLAAALAAAGQGFVVVMNEGLFDLGVGVYPPANLRRARPRF